MDPVVRQRNGLNGRRFLLAGSVIGFISVAAGAFGAHALRAMVTPERLEVFHTGTRYAMVHAVVLLIVGMLAESRSSDSLTFAGGALTFAGGALTFAGGAFTLGVLLFTGSLWVLVLADLPVLGMITPFGGLSLLAGWLSLGLALARPPTP